MKIMTILGTRPEIIRLSRVIHFLDQITCLTVVHTGQNFDARLNELFFDELGVRAPDYHLGAKGTFGEQVGTILSAMETLLEKERPDKVLILGDTNSGLSAISAKRLGIKVYHMEAGNRCYDDRVPEEVNRRIIDHSSDFLLPYTERSRQNLLREGLPGQRIFVTGNPILEVINHYEDKIADSKILKNLDLAMGNYFLVTLHRAENVDGERRLNTFIESINLLQKKYGYPVIVSTHPRTRIRMGGYGLGTNNPMVKFLEPFGFFDFITLERNAFCVLSDSGTVQEECSIFGIPSLSLRDVTERPETLECGSNLLSGAEPDLIDKQVRLAVGSVGNWKAPDEYLKKNVAETVTRILLSYSGD